MHMEKLLRITLLLFLYLVTRSIFTGSPKKKVKIKTHMQLFPPTYTLVNPTSFAG